MSHQPERQEKNCLNCGTTVIGRYCHVCGQENIETRETFWTLLSHFVFDIFHFDGKFFYTLRYIFSRPGYPARQYAEGKRATYLHPIRMYLFTSAVFFLAFFSIDRFQIHETPPDHTPLTNTQRLAMASRTERKLADDPNDTALLRRIALLRDTSRPLSTADLPEPDMTFLRFGDRRYHSLKEYDSVQQRLPASERDGWLIRRLNRRGLQVDEKYRNNRAEGMKVFGEGILHRMPYLFFFSLPFFALILQLLYVRRKNFYYSDHAVFTLYHYILSFILMLVVIGILTLKSRLGWNWLGYINMALAVLWPVYLLLEMKYFYRQNWGRTVVKFLLLNVLASIAIFLLLVFFLFFSIFQM